MTPRILIETCEGFVVGVHYDGEPCDYVVVDGTGRAEVFAPQATRPFPPEGYDTLLDGMAAEINAFSERLAQTMPAEEG